MDRRHFIRSTVIGAGLAAIATGCRNDHLVKGKIVGASANIGHLLRDKDFSKPVSTASCKVVIIGGGVSGLSAARWLQKNNISDVVMLDIETNMGGNAASGSNNISAYPWGAHYIPIPNNDLSEYLAFLQEHNVITGYDAAGLPVYNEYYLCFDPEERLYINGHWQEGLIPHFGVPENDRKQLQQFLQLVDDLRYRKGSDGKDVFAIPVDRSSKDMDYTALDNVTMKEWMQQNSYTSVFLHWYLDYCMRDGFGTAYDKISAWAGLHYFAARKGKAANAAHQDVLTWPEGNGFLVKKLMESSAAKKYNECLAVNITNDHGKAIVTYFDVKANEVKAISADQCICCIPQFVATRLLKDEQRSSLIHEHLHYAPWMVANLRVKELEERKGAPSSWDNVIYGSASLGYVTATHQLLQQHLPEKNLTYYLPLTGDNAVNARKKASALTHADWVEKVFTDLQKVHPNIRTATQEINVMVWGHAMAQPLPGLIHGNVRQLLSQSIGNHIHFAHTDLAGISIFEEAFYQGIGAATKTIQALTS